jgi:hypothetical protein
VPGVSPDGRARLTEIALAAVFSGVAAWIYLAGEERDGAIAFFLAWAAVHVAFGLATGRIAALAIAVAGPPLFVASGGGSWVEAVFVELFYGLAFTFTGLVARRAWQAWRPTALPEDGQREHGGA